MTLPTAILFDLGGTLLREAPPGTPVADLRVDLHDGAFRTLIALRDAGFRLGAVTDTSVMTEADVRALLTPSGISDLLEVVVTSVDVGAAKPDPQGIHLALERLGGVDPSAALFVGDREIDREAAEAAGMAGFVMVSDTAPALQGLRRWMADKVGDFSAARLLVPPLDSGAAAEAAERQLRLTKPPGALGRLEELGAQLCAISSEVPPPIPLPAKVAVFAGDHGVLAQGVTPWPREVTAQMVANFVAGGAAVNVLADQSGAEVVVVDVGVATPIPVGEDVGEAGGLLHRNVGAGTADLSVTAALTLDQVDQALDVGAEVAARLVDAGARCLITGDMGIGNTTPAAALIAAFTGTPAAEVTGRGTGIDNAALTRKTAAVAAGVARLNERHPHRDARTVMAEVGGLEHAALAGFIVGAAAARVPVIVDGVIACSALLAAVRLCPAAQGYVVAGHRSVEPGASVALAALGLEPLLDLGLRLGEGTGAVLALPLLVSAARVLSEMATFDAAGVTTKED